MRAFGGGAMGPRCGHDLEHPDVLVVWPLAMFCGYAGRPRRAISVFVN